MRAFFDMGDPLTSARTSGDTADDIVAAIVPARAREPTAEVAANVVPFVRPRREPAALGTGPAIVIDPHERPAPERRHHERARIAGLLALSLLMHGGLLALALREPPPLASIGVEVISVEIVVGANMPSGPLDVPTETDVQSPPAPQEQVETAELTEPDPVEAAVAAEVEEVTPESRVAEQPATQAETRMELEPARETPPQPALAAEETPHEPELAATPREQPQFERPLSLALTPPPDTKPEPEKQREVRPKQAATPKRDAQPKSAPPRRETAPRDRDARPKVAARPPAASAGGLGAGRSSTDTNYRGLVAAHLARYKRFPADARSRGEQGTAVVSFALDGSGRVTRVSVVRGTGYASIDQEARAMVRRASPFPAPPDGRAVSFTVPLTFRIQ